MYIYIILYLHEIDHDNCAICRIYWSIYYYILYYIDFQFGEETPIYFRKLLMRNQTSYLCTSFVQAKRNQRLLLLDIIKTFSSKYSHSGNNQYLQQIEYPLQSNEIFKNESINMFSDSLIGDVNDNLCEWKNLNELVLSGNNISDSSFFLLCNSLSKIKAPNLKNLFINRIFLNIIL